MENATQYLVWLNTSYGITKSWQNKVKETLHGLLILEACAVILGNIFLLFSIAKFRYLQTITNILIFSLSLSDLMCGVVSIFYALDNYYRCIYLVFCICLYTCSMLNLLFVSFERYFTVFHHLVRQKYGSQKKAVLCSTGIWIFIFMMITTLLRQIGFKSDNYDECAMNTFSMTTVTVPLLLSVSFMLAFHLRLLVHMRRMKREVIETILQIENIKDLPKNRPLKEEYDSKLNSIEDENPMPDDDENSSTIHVHFSVEIENSEERKNPAGLTPYEYQMIKAVVGLVTYFFITTIIGLVIYISSNVIIKTDIYSEDINNFIEKTVHSLCGVISLTNSMVNPIFYLYFCNDFRRAFAQMSCISYLCKERRRRRSNDKIKNFHYYSR